MSENKKVNGEIISPIKDKPFFHEVTDQEWEKMKDDGRNVGWLMKNYRQPDWCNYHEALSGHMGCWSLMDRSVKDKDYCKEGKCDSYKKK